MIKQFEKKQFKQLENQSQSGRSMIEMLGVLAIIAILSIGGIIMFRYAMNYYQANQIAHEMNIMRTDAQIKIAQGTEKLILGEPYDPINESTLGHIQFNDDYPVDFACALADDETVELSNISCHVANAYYIELQNIPEGVCRPLAELVNGMSNVIAFDVNKNEYPETGKCEAGNENVLNAVFSAEAVSELKVCTEDTDCESENAPHCDPSRHVCVRCYEDNQCAHNQYCENNTCVTCESGVWNGEDCVECTADDDCADKTDTPVCYTAEYKCVECLTYRDCKNEERPQCDEASHTCKSCAEIDERTPVWGGIQCVECVNSTDCAETLVCRENTCSLCQTEEECQEKGISYHCSKEDTCIQCAANQVWDDESKECVECLSSADCKNPEKPQCNTTTNQCVECKTNEDCTTDKPQCDTNTNTCKSCAEINPNEPLWVDNECKACPADQPWNGKSCGCRDNALCFTTFGNNYYCHKTKKTDLIDGETGACKKIDLPLYKKLSDGVEVWASTTNIVNYWNTCRLCEARAGKDGSECSRNDYSSPNMVDLDFFQCANKEQIKQAFSSNTKFYCHKTSADTTVYDENNVAPRVLEIEEMIHLMSPWLTDVSPHLDKTLWLSFNKGHWDGVIQCCRYGHEEGGDHYPLCVGE